MNKLVNNDINFYWTFLSRIAVKYRFRSIIRQIGIVRFTVDIKSSQTFIEEILNRQHS